MEEVVNRLSQIESISTGIIEDASIQKKALSLENIKRMDAFDAETDAETAKSISELTGQLDRQLSEELSRLRDATDSELERITNLYHSHHTELAQELLKKVIGAD